jgi:hypothetical protein
MPRYDLVWLEIAEQQYRALAPDLRAEVDRWIATLVENPTEPLEAVYNKHSDQWSVPLADRGFLFYAVVRAPAKLIILRVVVISP